MVFESDYYKIVQFDFQKIIGAFDFCFFVIQIIW